MSSIVAEKGAVLNFKVEYTLFSVALEPLFLRAFSGCLRCGLTAHRDADRCGSMIVFLRLACSEHRNEIRLSQLRKGPCPYTASLLTTIAWENQGRLICRTSCLSTLGFTVGVV